MLNPGFLGSDGPLSYAALPKSIGEHIRKRRLDLGLRQRDLAGRLSVDMETVRHWELGQTNPVACLYTRIIRFLGYDPAPRGTLGERLQSARLRLGLGQKKLALQVGLDEGSVCRWERGHRKAFRMDEAKAGGDPERPRGGL